ncbi:MAG: hypothetical protein WBA22_14085 [Candidatus Methanofastidiosia archaeon]
MFDLLVGQSFENSDHAEIQTDLYELEICHTSMRVVPAQIWNGIIYPKEKLNIDDKDALIRIEDTSEMRLGAREDTIQWWWMRPRVDYLKL